MELSSFDELSLTDQISILKQYASIYEDSQAPTVLFQLLLMIKDMEIPELIGVTQVEGEAWHAKHKLWSFM